MNSGLIKHLYTNIFQSLGIEHLPDERKRDILGNLTEVLEKRIFLKIVNKLKEVEREEFANLLSDDDKSDEQKIAFIHNHIPDFTDFLETEIALFKKELHDSVEKDIAEDILQA